MIHKKNQQNVFEWQDVTADVKTIKYISNNNEMAYYEITYKNGKLYNHNTAKIRWLKDPKTIQLTKFRPVHNGITFFNIVDGLLFGDWCRFFFENGTARAYSRDDIEWIELTNDEPKVKEYLDYLKECVTVANSESDVKILQEQLNNLSVSKDSVLYQVINNEHAKRREKIVAYEELILPFAFNQSQREAVYNGLNHRLSLIQGPPGTGKTQTILNIIANAVYRGATVAVVSGNNEATKNVQEKLQKYSFDFLTAYIGSNDNTAKFFNENRKIPDVVSEWKNRSVNSSELKNRLQQLSTNNISELELAIAQSQLKREIGDLKIEQAFFKRDNFIYKSYISKKVIRKIDNHYTLERLLELKAELETLSEKKLKSLFTKMRFLSKYGIFKTKTHFAMKLQTITYLTHRQYELQLEKLERALEKVVKHLNMAKNVKIVEQINNISLQLFQTKVAERYTGNCDLTQSNYRAYFKNFLKRHPIVLSTTHSIVKTSGMYHLYDYVVIDESSQVCLASAAIAFACAKNVILVGDLMQIPNIIQSKNKQSLSNIFNKYDLKEYHNYVKYSVLESIVTQFKGNVNVPSVLLNEHYRCDPEIIGFCNKRFYNDKLVIQTNHKQGNGVHIIYSESKHAKFHPSGGVVNERQVDIIDQEILPLLGNEEYGIATPFRKQVELLKSKFGESHLIDTIHKFQGKERKNIILSTVSNKVDLTREEEPDFLNNPNLLNVAISRAQDKLFVVISEELMKQTGAILSDFARYIKYYTENGKIEKSNVYSVMDLMYKTYSPVLEKFKAKLKKISKYESENIVNAVIEEICEEGKFGVLGFHINYALILYWCSVTIKGYAKSQNKNSLWHVNRLSI